MKLNKYNEYEIELSSTIFEKIRFSIYRNELPNLNEFSIAGIRFVKMKEEQHELMTRKEAEEIIYNIFGYGNVCVDKWLKVYEALGLIKFKEEKKDEERILIDCLDGFTRQTNMQNIIKSLESLGYMVRKNG